MRSGIPDPDIPSDWLILTVFVNSGESSITARTCDMTVMTDSTCRHAEFKLVTHDFPNVEAKSEEQRNCLKHVVGRIDVLAISHRLALKKFLFSSFFLE